MNCKLKKTQQLNCTLETAWKYFSAPGNLAEITPQELKFIIVSDVGDEIYEGMEIDYTVSPLLGIPMKWRTLITQVNAPYSFTDMQTKGPYKRWNHHHEFIANKNGVLMKDTVRYALPFGFLGRIAHKWVVKKKLDHIFNYRYTVLEKLFNTVVKK